MTTRTTTLTLHAPQYAEKIRELTTILREHQNETDELSLQLIDFGTAILFSAKENRHASLEVQTRVADAHVQLLANKVLKCPLFVENFLVNPLLGSDGVGWSAPEYSLCYQRCDGISPFDGNPMDENPRPHLFARKMVVLAGLAPAREEGKEEAAVAIHIEMDPMLKTAWKALYQQLAALAQGRMQSQRQQRSTRASQRYMGNALVQMRQGGTVLAQQSAERDLAFRAEVVQTVQLMQRTYDGEIAALRGQREAAEAAHRTQIALLQQQASANREQAAAVAARIREMNGAHQTGMNAFNEQIRSLETRHQQLERRRENEGRENEARMIAMANQHKKEAEADWKRVQSARAEIGVLAEENAANKTEISQLRANLNWAMHEIANMDTGCKVM